MRQRRNFGNKYYESTRKVRIIVADQFYEIIPILENPKHPDRRPIGSGPLFCHLAKKDPPEANIVNMADLFFATNITLRKATLDYFNNLEDSKIPFLTSKSRNILKTLGKSLLSDDSQQWRNAAVAIHDALEDDWYCNYAALRQCLSKNFIPGVEEFLTKVIRPTIPSVESVTIGVWAATEKKEEILQQIDKIVEEELDITTALNEYFIRFGHLPFANKLSIIQLIDQWQLKHGNIDNKWLVLWSWANSSEWPLNRYHVCAYFISHPETIPSDKYTELWNEIAEIIFMPNDEKEDINWTQHWRMLCEIARHFCCHLESSLPFKDGERIASQAWWLAVQVCKLFPSNKDKVKQLRDETFLPELAFSSRIWKVASPAIKPSSLRFLTLNANSPFSLALQSTLGNSLDSLNPVSMNKENFKKIEDTISGSILAVFPPKLKKDTDIVYAFDYFPLTTAKKWVNYIDKEDKNKEMINAFIIGIEKLIKSESFTSVLKKFDGSHTGDQILIANYLKNMVFTEEIPLDNIWDTINDSNWRESAFRKSHPIILELIFDAFNEIETRYQDKWAYNLPHFYALECEQVEDKDKRQHFFSYVIYSSLCGSSVSAIQRLLKGDCKFEYQEEVNHWRKYFTEIQKWAPEWVKARIRPVLCVLHI